MTVMSELNWRATRVGKAEHLGHFSVNFIIIPPDIVGSVPFPGGVDMSFPTEATKGAGESVERYALVALGANCLVAKINVHTSLLSLFHFDELDFHAGEPPMVDFVVKDAVADLPGEAEADEKLRLVLKTWQSEHLRDVFLNPCERVVVAAQLEIGSGFRLHLPRPLLLGVGTSVGVVSARVEDLHGYVVGEHERSRILSEIHQVLSAVHMSPVMVVKAVHDERTEIDAIVFERLIVVVAGNEESPKTFPRRIVLNAVAGLVHAASGLDELVMSTIDIPAIYHRFVNPLLR